MSRSDEPEVHYELTEREAVIVGHVASGLSSKEVALALGIAPSTVESHLESAKLKLRARSRPNLIALAIECGAVTLVSGHGIAKVAAKPVLANAQPRQH